MSNPTRPANAVTLVAWALCTLDDALTYLKRPTDDDNDIVRGLINDATNVIETRCGRKLKSRTYDGVPPNEAPLLADGTGEGWIEAPQWPVTGLSSARYKLGDLSGTWIDLRIDQWLEVPNGLIELAFDAFPLGKRNVEIKMTAGYLAGTHDRELGILNLACRRIVQIMWQDRDMAVGRGTGFSVAGQSVSLIPDDLPRDIRSMLGPFERFY